jgi:hypothetical protein
LYGAALALHYTACLTFKYDIAAGAMFIFVFAHIEKIFAGAQHPAEKTERRY